MSHSTTNEFKKPGQTPVPETNGTLGVQRERHNPVCDTVGFPEWEYQLLHVASHSVLSIHATEENAIATAKFMFPLLTPEQWETPNHVDLFEALEPHGQSIFDWRVSQ